MIAQNSILLDQFEAETVDIADIELEELHALSISVCWPHRPEDWQLLRKVGKGFVAVDKIGRVMGSVMWFPYGQDFASIGMVIISPRLQTKGAGRWLMDRVLAETGGRALGLNATREALRLYVSLGFTIAKTVFQIQGNAAVPPAIPLPEGATLREVMPGDLAQLAELDSIAYGACRAELLARLLEISKGLVLERNERIEAFSLCRRFGRGHVVGPIVAATDQDAIAVTRPHIVNHAGQFVRVDTRREDGAFRDLLAASKLSVYDTVISMWQGKPWPVSAENTAGDSAMTYGLVSHTLG